MSELVNRLNRLYSNELKASLLKFTGTKYEKDLKFCAYSPDEGVQSCPIHSEKEENGEGFEHQEFVMVVHNPSMYN